MPKVKVPRKNISLDMTAMCDMAFLLLTFFILATRMKAPEPVAVDIPSSTDKKTVPADSILIISIDKTGKVFFGIDNQIRRKDLIDFVSERGSLALSNTQKERFSTLETFGIPLEQLKSYLDKPGEGIMKDQPGIPSDSTDNQLITWIGSAKKLFPFLRIAIKGDRETDFEDIKKVMNALEALNLHHMSYVTNLESKPDRKQ
jgi:biopolymer transport protein ExbD